MAGLNWQDIAGHFAPDGTLRDIYVFDTTMEDWEAVWVFLTSDLDRLTFSVDDVPATPPETVVEVFAAGRDHSVLASYVLGSQILNCHFFDEAEIEFDIGPRQVDRLEPAHALADFMTAIGRLVSKPVILTEENDQTAVIARFDPDAGSVEWNSGSVTTAR
jgi:hypothetical protein